MDKQKTLNLYMDYIQAFENKNYDSIANVCRTPFFVSSPSGTIIFENREELHNYKYSRLENINFEHNQEVLAVSYTHLTLPTTLVV